MAKKIRIDTELVLTSPNIKPIVASLKKQLSGITGTVDIKFKPNTANNLSQINRHISDLRKNLQYLAKDADTASAAINRLASSTNRINTNINRQTQQIVNYNRSLTNTKSSVKNAGSAIEDFGKKSALAIKRYAAFTVATAGIIGFGVAAKRAFGEAVSFEREFIKVSQVTGKSVSQLRGLNDEIDRLSTGLGVSSKTLVNTAQVLAQAGLTAKDTKIALESLAKTELSPTFGRIEETTEGAIAAMQQFQIQAKDLDKTLSSMNAVAGAFAVESEDLITVIQKAGGAFRATGGNLNELLALFTSVRQTTRESADAIATGLRTIFTRLERPNTLKFLETLGVKLTDAQGNFIGVYKSIGLLSEALGKIGANDPRLTQIFEELGGYRQISRVVPLIQQYAVAERALGIAQRGQNTLTADAITAQQTLSIQLTKVQEEFKSLFRVIAGDASIRQIITLTLELAKSLNQVAKSLQPILPLITAVGAVKFAGLAQQYGKSFVGGLKRASGGPVPGSGSGDTVPAMLTPGEYVINKSAASRIGVNNLEKLNGVQKFASGGFVGSINPRGATGVGLLLLPSIISSLTHDMGELGTHINRLTNVFTVLAIAATSFGVKLNSLTSLAEKPSSIANRLKGRELNLEALNATRKNAGYIDRFSQSQVSGLRNSVVQELYKGLPPGLQPHPTLVDQITQQRLGKLNSARRDINNEIFKKERSRILNEKVRGVNFENSVRGGQIAGVGLGLVGGYISSVGGENIRRGNKTGVTQSLFGGALTGAGVGAGLGASFGPVGFAAGGTIGALVGLAEAARTASDQLKQVEVQKTFDEFSDSIDRILSGKSTVSSQSTRQISTINELNNQLSNLPSGESRDLIVNNLKGATASLENLVLKITSESKSFDQFKGGNGGLGGKVLGVLSIAANTPLKDLEDEVKKNIKLNQESLTIQEKLNKATFESANEIEKFVRFAKAINDASIATEKLSNEFDILDSAISGSAKVGRFVGGAGADFVQQSTGSDALFNTAQKLEDVAASLPDILVSLRGENPLEEKVFNNFADKLKDIPSFIRNQILAQAEGIQGGETGFLKEIDKNVFDLAKKLTDGFDPILDSIKTINDEFKTQVNNLGAGFSKFNENELSLIEGRVRSENLSQKSFEAGRTLRNQPISEGEFNAFQLNKRNIRLGGTGVNGSAKDLADAIIDLRNKIAEANKQRETAGKDSILEATKALSDLTLKSSKLSKALEDMATNTEKLNFLEQKLNEERQKTSLKQDFAKKFAFGSQEEQLQLNKDIRAAQIASQFGTVKGFSAENKAGALRVLEQVGDTKLAAFGGLSGKENIRKIAANDLGGSGLDPELLKTLQNTSTEEERLITEIQNFIDSQKSAQDELNRVLQTGNKDLGDRLEQIFNNFTAKQEELLKQSTISSLNRSAAGVQGKVFEQQAKLVAFDNLGQFGGLSGAKSISSNQQLISQRNKLYADQKSLNKNLQSFINNTSRLGIKSTTGAEREGSVEFAKSLLNDKFKGLFSQEEILKLEGELNSLKSGGIFGRTQSEQSLAIQGAVGRAAQEKLEANKKTLFGTEEQPGGLERQLIDTFGGVKEFNDVLKITSQSLKEMNESLRVIGESGSPDEIKQTIKGLLQQADSINADINALQPQGKAMGGSIFSPRGTDTVPAMLTPGEFVVNRKSAQANLGLLHEINSGSGGSYFAGGGYVSERRQKILDRRRQRVLDRFSAREAGMSLSQYYSTNRYLQQHNLPLLPTANSSDIPQSTSAFRGTVAERRQHELGLREERRNFRKTNFQFSSSNTTSENIKSGRKDRSEFLKNASSSVGGRLSRNELIERARANRKSAGLAKGGIVGYANGGMVSGYAGGGNVEGGFNESVTKFISASNSLAEALSKFPSTISLETTGRIEVIHNGLEMFQQMQPAIASYVDGKIKDAVNKLMKGPLQGAAPR